MKIGFYISGFDGCGYYRVQLVAKYLNRIEGVHAKIFSQYSREDIRWADILVLQKQSNQKALEFIKYGKSLGKKIVTEVDDDFFNIPVWNPAHKHYLGKGQDLINFYKMSDAITVTTPHLAQQLSKYNPRTYVLPNSLDIPALTKFESMGEDKLLKYTQYMDSSKEKISLEKANDIMEGKVVIGWGGSPTHFKDLEQVSDSLIQLCSDNPNVVINMAGSCVDKLIKGVQPEQLLLVGAVPIYRYPQVVSSLGWDIGICPVEDNLFNRSKCVIGNTKVQTEKGLVSISKLSKHRVADTVDFSSKGLVKTDVGFEAYDGFYYGGEQECLRILTKSGYTLSGTKTHRLMISGEWVEMQNILVGDTLQIHPLTNTVENYVEVNFPLFMHKLYSQECLKTYDHTSPKVTIDETWGRFLGYMVGDGYVSASSSMCVSCSTDYPDIIEDVKRIVRGFGLHPFVVPKKDKRVLDDNGEVRIGKGRDVKFTSGIFVNFLKNLGIRGKRGKVLRVPDVIFESPLGVMREFLRGLFEADSHTLKSSSGCRLVSKDRLLMEDVQQLLLFFGIKAIVKPLKAKAQTWDKKKTYYCCILNSKSARLFEERVNYISEIKRDILGKRCSVKRSNTFDDWDFTETVETIETLKEDVFDICVPSVKRYLANGILSHNSNLKYLEFAQNGYTCVCSDVENYRKTLENGVTGILSKNTPEDWYNNLAGLVNSETARSSIASKGIEFVEENFNIEKNIHLWHDLYLKLLGK